MSRTANSQITPGANRSGRVMATSPGIVVLTLALGLCLALGNTVRANCDLEIEIVELHVVDDTGDDPDVYVWVNVQRSELPPTTAWVSNQTSVIDDQVVCTHPHQGTTMWITHVDPFAVKWKVIDRDPVFDDVMTQGSANVFNQLFPCNGTKSVTLTSGPAGAQPGATITLEITSHASECGGNVNCTSRAFPEDVAPDTLITVTLTLNIDETSSPELVTLTEQIPGVFGFQSAEPPASSVVFLTDDDGLTKTEVSWDFVAPPVGTTTITYDIMTPDSEDLFCAMFRNRIEVDGNVYYCQMQGNQVAIGPGEDCDLNGIPDPCQVAKWPWDDLNENGIPDICEEAIPTVSEWGMVAMTLLLLTAGALVLRRRRALPA